MTTPEQRVGVRGAQKRRWDRENRSACVDCGVSCARDASRCATCHKLHGAARRHARWARIAALWNDGATMPSIAAAVGTTKKTLSVEMSDMRAAGWWLPYRRVGSAQPGKHPELRPERVAA